MGQAVIAIRAFGESDVAAAAGLEASHQPSPWSEKTFADELAAENRIYLVAADDDLVGFCGVMVVGEEAHITNLLVDPGKRGQGIGRRLMASLIREAVAEGAKHLTLEVRSRNEAARGLYESLGLAPVGVRPGYYDDDDALILWAHDIDRDEYLERLG